MAGFYMAVPAVILVVVAFDVDAGAAAVAAVGSAVLFGATEFAVQTRRRARCSCSRSSAPARGS